MDGDNSTTDASQLGITGEYMSSGHYVLQSQDGEEEQQTPTERPPLLAFGSELILCVCVCVCFVQMMRRRV